MGSASFALLDTQRGEDNVVQQPRAARATRGNHKYDSTIVNNKITGYVPVTYEHQEFPRMMYHPDWGAKARPDMTKFAVGCVTPEQFQGALTAYTEAEQKWMRSNRTKLAADPKQFDALKKKGWLDKPPLRKENAGFDLESDEL